MGPIRSPLGAIGAVLVVLEGIAAGTLFALDSDPLLRLAIVATMIFVLVSVTVVVLGIAIYFAKTKPGFLFNPADIARLSESTQQSLFPNTSSLTLEPHTPQTSVVISNIPDWLGLPEDLDTEFAVDNQSEDEDAEDRP